MHSKRLYAENEAENENLPSQCDYMFYFTRI